MSATEISQALAPRPVGGATLLWVDVKVQSILFNEARHRAIERVFGIPRDEQSLLVTATLAGAAATVLAEAVIRPAPHISGADAAIAGSVMNTALGGLAGATAQTVPFAGALIAFALVAHALRPAVGGSVRGVRAMGHGVRVGMGRYGHARLTPSG